MILFHLFFLLCTTIRPKIRVLIELIYLFLHDHLTKIYGPLSLFFLVLSCSSFALFIAIRPKIKVSSIYFAYLHTTIRLMYVVFFHLFFLFYTTTQPKIMVLTHLFRLFGHNHSPKIYGPVLPLYFVRYIHRSTALIFCPLYSCLHEVLVEFP